MYNDWVKELVEMDLEKYGQHNPCPKSLTIVDNRGWRHYELGSIYGFVAYNRMTENGEWFGLASISEDDEHWFVSDAPMNMAAFWVNAVKSTYDRMAAWITDHIFEGWEEGKPMDSSNYVVKILKPIENDVVMFDGEPDNAVLGTKWINNAIQ